MYIKVYSLATVNQRSAEKNNREKKRVMLPLFEINRLNATATFKRYWLHRIFVVLPSCTGFQFVHLLWSPFCFSSSRFNTVSMQYEPFPQKHAIFSFFNKFVIKFLVAVFLEYNNNSLWKFSLRISNDFNYLRTGSICVSVFVCFLCFFFIFGSGKNCRKKRIKYFACQFPIKISIFHC